MWPRHNAHLILTTVTALLFTREQTHAGTPCFSRCQKCGSSPPIGPGSQPLCPKKKQNFPWWNKSICGGGGVLKFADHRRVLHFYFWPRATSRCASRRRNLWNNFFSCAPTKSLGTQTTGNFVLCLLGRVHTVWDFFLAHDYSAGQLVEQLQKQHLHVLLSFFAPNFPIFEVFKLSKSWWRYREKNWSEWNFLLFHSWSWVTSQCFWNSEQSKDTHPEKIAPACLVCVTKWRGCLTWGIGRFDEKWYFEVYHSPSIQPFG